MSIEQWYDVIMKIDYAFQPIVNIYTGKVIAYEALLRQYEEAGFNTIEEFFDRAYNDKVLHRLDIMLRQKALTKFINANFDQYARLFYNLDSRIIETYDYKAGETTRLLEEMDLSKNLMTFEISEKHEFKSFLQANSVFNLYQQQGYQIALDDFGTGFSGLKLLYHSEPNYIKIDRFFITDIFKDSKKRLFITNIINIAHSIGALIIAEGVETKEEYYICKEIGCDCIQGYYVARPCTDIEKLKASYDTVKELAKADKREKNDKSNIKKYLREIDKVTLDTKMEEIFNIFKRSSYSYLVVVDDIGRPLGLLREKTLRKYIYNPFGNSLLTHKVLGEKVEDFLTSCSSVEINTDISKILKAFSFNSKADGVIVTKNFKYFGFIDARSILDFLNNRNLIDARNQNPLSKLPGNKNVEEFIENALEEAKGQVVFTYFDFNDFKPFNDTYGFRNGDRVILLFSDIIRKIFKRSDYFIGHIGGDDFFMGTYVGKQHTFEEVAEDVAQSVARFKKDVESFYSSEDKKRGYIQATDRTGQKRQFPLLSVSAATLVVNFECGSPDGECCTKGHDLSELMAAMKKGAKAAPGNLLFAGCYR